MLKPVIGAEEIAVVVRRRLSLWIWIGEEEVRDRAWAIRWEVAYREGLAVARVSVHCDCGSGAG